MAPVSLHGTEMPQRDGAELGVSGGGELETPGRCAWHVLSHPLSETLMSVLMIQMLSTTSEGRSFEL